MYSASAIEQKWQKRWEKSGLYHTDLDDDTRPKYYNLVMFPYPSGDKLHVGHWYNYAPADSWGRYMRMKGYTVFEPIGFDSFGLPAENYAIKTGIHPTKSIADNCRHMSEQLRKMGTMYDWDKTVVTSDPEYYRWTQWVFLQLYKKGLAYRRKAPVNWCPGCQTVLANEQVVEGQCERCKNAVTKKDMTQWFFDIRSYAERLLHHDDLEWPEKTILMQKNWIGRSEGSTIVFDVELADGGAGVARGVVGSGQKISVYTTRIDTLFGCTYMVLAPEHPLVGEITAPRQRREVEEYIEKARRETDIDRGAEGREKTGVNTGAFAINPVNGERVPVWIADYVLVTYGTGAVMAVPAHDERDFDFAVKYKLPIRRVITPNDVAASGSGAAGDRAGRVVRGADVAPPDVAFTDDGTLVNSSDFSGMSSEEARRAITEMLRKHERADFKVNYKLRDWLISRQRYWGAPIPIIICPKCGDVPVAEGDLPVLLPKDVDFIPRGKSPLAYVPDFIKAKCPTCGGDAERESDTMDTFMCSSWYFLRYPSAHLDSAAFDKKLINRWLPVDMYIGGPEHACMHLLYARFITMALHDMGHIDFDEPFKRLVHQGLVTKDGAKMSKSKGNVVSPDDFVSKYGSDVFRMYLMFMGPFEGGGDWNDHGITGVARFVDRFWTLMTGDAASGAGDAAGGTNGDSGVRDERGLHVAAHRAIKRVVESIEVFHFNTAIAALMEFVNAVSKIGINAEYRKIMTRLIAPLAPHLAEEIWEHLGETTSVFAASYPTFDASLLVEDVIELPVQVNGKVRGTMRVPKDISERDVIAAARAVASVAKYLEGVTVAKEIYIAGRMVSFVVK